jgi:hypothetical protein
MFLLSLSGWPFAVRSERRIKVSAIGVWRYRAFASNECPRLAEPANDSNVVPDRVRRR